MKPQGLLFVASLVAAKDTSSPAYQILPPLREQASLVNSWTSIRRSNIPSMLKSHNVSAWLISQREYAEDTIFWPLKSATQFSARRRTTTLFLASGETHEWIDNTEKVWDELNEVFEREDPETIVVNAHGELAFAGGLHAGERDVIQASLASKWVDRFVVDPMVPISYAGTQILERLPWYKSLQETAWAIISTAFSSAVISPGTTTTADVEWWMREQIQALNYTTWFQPSVSIIDEAFPWTEERAIAFGDMLHVDFGVTALGMNTDTQHLAYVLPPKDKEVPQGLKDGLATANRLQDLVKENMKPGMTGNEILKASRQQMEKEGIEGKVYCHAIGDWGHSAGAVIGKHPLYLT